MASLVILVQVIVYLVLLGKAFCDVSDGSIETTLQETELNETSDALLLHPPNKLVVFMEQEHAYDLNFNISCKSMDDLIMSFESKHESIFRIKGNDAFTLSCLSSDDGMGFLNASSSHVTEPVLYSNGTVRITLTGKRLGVADLIVSIRPAASAFHQTPGQNMSDLPLAKEVLPVFVLRRMRVLDKVFVSVVPVLIVFVMIGFGCKLDLEVVKECVKKPLAPGIGFGCQYLVMPLLGFTIGKLVPTGDRGISLGIFLCGICPGGGISNIYTYLLDGDVSLSITMTFFSALASIGMMPLWIYTLGRVFTDGYTDLTIPYVDILQTTALVTCSLLVGVFLKYKFHKVAMAFVRILRPVAFVLVICMMSVGIYSNLYIFKMFQPVHLMAGCLLPYCGYALGGIISALFRLPWTRVKTVAIETGLQNISVAYMLLMKSLPPPFGDIAALAPAASALMTPIPLLLISIVYTIYKRCTRKYEEVEQNPDAEKSNVQNGATNGKVALTEKLSTV